MVSPATWYALATLILLLVSFFLVVVLHLLILCVCLCLFLVLSWFVSVIVDVVVPFASKQCLSAYISSLHSRACPFACFFCTDHMERHQTGMSAGWYGAAIDYGLRPKKFILDRVEEVKKRLR
eukprot:3178113-Rhodomonas_salina.3